MTPEEKRQHRTRSAVQAIQEFFESLGAKSSNRLKNTQHTDGNDESVVHSVVPHESRHAKDSDTRESVTQRLLNSRRMLLLGAIILLTPEFAHAAELEQTLRNLVTAFTGRILPILSLGYLGKNIFAHIQGDPNAKHETVRVVIATACLLGLAGVWNFISQQAR